ncbi:MAG: hypothetical protein LM514_04760, partial [Streptococcus sp.]|nr:hypothetical protein [Streptococcus sp.]
MNSLMMSTAKQSKMTRQVARRVLATFLTSFVCFSANSEPYQRLLFLGGGNVAGNLALVASLEFPTMVSVAHIKTNNTYDSTTTNYIGYFDPQKCYRYSYSATESERHFYP